MVTSIEREQLITDINDSNKQMARVFAQQRATPLLDSTLTMQQLKSLVVLSTEDGLSSHQLADRLGVKLGTVTGIVDRLIAQNLVSRTEDPHDRRIRRVRLTAEGTSMLDHISDTGTSQFRKLLQELDTTTLRQFKHATEQLLQAAKKLRPH